MSSDIPATGSDITATGDDRVAATAGIDYVVAGARRLLEEGFNEGKLGGDRRARCAGSDQPRSRRPAHRRQLRGPEAFKLTVGLYRQAFPDLRLIIDDVIAADDNVVVRWHAEGTHRGELEGLAPTGTRASVTGIGIGRWEDGKLVEAWTEWDNLGLAPCLAPRRRRAAWARRSAEVFSDSQRAVCARRARAAR